MAVDSRSTRRELLPQMERGVQEFHRSSTAREAQSIDNSFRPQLDPSSIDGDRIMQSALRGSARTVLSLGVSLFTLFMYSEIKAQSHEFIDLRSDLQNVDVWFAEGFDRQEPQALLPSPDSHPLLLAFGDKPQSLVPEAPVPYHLGIHAIYLGGVPKARGWEAGVFVERPGSRLGFRVVEELYVADDDITKQGQVDVSARGISSRGIRLDWEARLGSGDSTRFQDAWLVTHAGALIEILQLRYKVGVDVAQATFIRSSTAAQESGWHAAARSSISLYLPRALALSGGVISGIPGDSELAVRPLMAVDFFFLQERLLLGWEVLGTRNLYRVGVQYLWY